MYSNVAAAPGASAFQGVHPGPATDVPQSPQSAPSQHGQNDLFIPNIEDLIDRDVDSCEAIELDQFLCSIRYINALPISREHKLTTLRRWRRCLAQRYLELQNIVLISERNQDRLAMMR